LRYKGFAHVIETGGKTMLKQVEKRNRKVWKGHSAVLQDTTHVIGGAGLGMLLHPSMEKQSKRLAVALLLLSTALHVYADRVKP
jgi:hypothetical protein